MSGKPLRALLVDDSEIDAMLLLRELEKGGYEPDYRRVQTPEEMEEALEEGSWEVVLSEYDMPRFGAVAALESLRGAGHDTPFVVVSVAEGLESREIAERFSVTVETEHTHMVNILHKLGVHSRLQALVFAARHGVVQIR